MSEYEKIIFETDEGEEEFYIIDDTKINEVNYILVTDAADPDAEIEVMILKDVSTGDDEESVYEAVTDENEIKAVAPLFEESIGDVDIS